VKGQTLSALWRGAQSLLPMAVVAALAAYTWWLVQSAPRPEAAAQAEVPASVPDYVLERAQVERVDAQGRRASLMTGSAMRHYQVGDRLEVDGLDLVAEDAAGQWLKATSRHALYQGLGDRVTLTQGAHVQARPAPGARAPGPLVFEGQELTVDMAKRLLTSSLPARLTSPDGRLQGSRLRHDARTGITDVGGRVTGAFDATPVVANAP